jgi:hypothetical protein
MRNTNQGKTENESETTVNETQAAPAGRPQRRGFGGYNKAASGLNTTTLKVEDDSLVIAFLEPENFSYALRHWIKYVVDGNQVTRAEWCLIEQEDYCPMCDMADKAKPVCFFNVVDIAAPGKVLVWEASADPTSKIQKEYNKLVKRGKALNDEDTYFVVSKEKGRNNIYSYSVDRQPADEIEAVWPSLHPLTSAQRATLAPKMYDESYVKYKTLAEIQEFVESIP